MWVSNEYILGTIEGVVEVHSIRWLFEDERLDSPAVREMKGIAWKQVPNRSGNRIPVHITEKIEEHFCDVVDDYTPFAFEGQMSDGRRMEDMGHDQGSAKTRAFRTTKSDNKIWDDGRMRWM